MPVNSAARAIRHLPIMHVLLALAAVTLLLLLPER